MSTRRFVFAAAFLGLLGHTAATAQTFDALGTRAAGMGGAFVAVADDASAVYWNPAGLAAGSFFSLVLDRSSATAEPAGAARAGSQSGFLFGLGVPALGISYYRLRGTRVGPATVEPGDGRNLTEGSLRLQSLVTHHGGLTLVQSIAQGVAVGTTLKLVRGVAGAHVGAETAGDRLGDAEALLGRGSNAFDADLGLLAGTGRVRVGLTVRNVLEPSFDTPDGDAFELKRQARAGLALMAVPGWLVSADVDLHSTADRAGYDRRDVALGLEGRLGPRAFLRTGTRFDTRAEAPGGRAATVSVGGSYALFGVVLLDGQVTAGSKWGGRGWGLGARFVY